MPDIKKWILEKFPERDFITRERVWVLLLTDIVAIALAVTVLVLSQLLRMTPLSVESVIAAIFVMAGSITSIAMLRSGIYTSAAHVTIALILSGIWYTTLAFAAREDIKTEMAYVVASLTLPALLLGRAWTIFYCAASLVLTWSVAYVMAQTNYFNQDMVVGFAVDYSAAIIFVGVFSSLVTSAYERALTRVKDLLAKQQKANTELAEMTVLLEQAEAQKRQFYRDTIYSVTNGKLQICDTEEVERYLCSAQIKLEVRDPASVTHTRHVLRDYLDQGGLTGESLDAFVLAIGEALNNGVKHAGISRAYAGKTDSALWVAIEDDGPGIESLTLPRVVLLRGYSTKPSLGLGYSIMLDASDRILLKTDSTGTTVILIKEVQEPHRDVPLDKMPDTWQNLPGLW